MEELLKKISQYQLFNFLLSGAVLVTLLSKTTSINLINDDVIAAFFTFYIVGLVISRIGSIIIEPSLKKLGVIKFVAYQEYLDAVKADPKIDTLSQENNTYRTLIATFLIFIIIFALDKHAASFMSGKSNLIIYALSSAILLLFVLAYHKQTSYITKRVKNSKEK